MIKGHTRLHVDANGTMTGQRYIDEVLLSHVRLFRGAVARSPDLNPIENKWDALGRQFAGRNSPTTNKNTLIRALTECLNSCWIMLCKVNERYQICVEQLRHLEGCVIVRDGFEKYLRQWLTAWLLLRWMDDAMTSACEGCGSFTRPGSTMKEGRIRSGYLPFRTQSPDLVAELPTCYVILTQKIPISRHKCAQSVTGPYRVFPTNPLGESLGPPLSYFTASPLKKKP
ncbi:hypothetical protein TNCV_3575691 [Trichonephila clavipes]|nr:hypothetical protein TNCV_3575691 [Trichonephila clavipes]